MIFRPKCEIQRFFPPKIRWPPKKIKIGLHQNWDWFFVQFRKFRRLRGAVFVWGGGYFSQKIGLKSTKNMRFCILHKPMGGARAPPGYATGSVSEYWWGIGRACFKVAFAQMSAKEPGTFNQLLVEWIEHLLLKRQPLVRSQDGSNQKLEKWYWQLPCLTFSIEKGTMWGLHRVE